MKFQITATETITYNWEVEADSMDDAIDAAEEMWAQSEQPEVDFHGVGQGIEIDLVTPILPSMDEAEKEAFNKAEDERMNEVLKHAGISLPEEKKVHLFNVEDLEAEARSKAHDTITGWAMYRNCSVAYYPASGTYNYFVSHTGRVTKAEFKAYAEAL